MDHHIEVGNATLFPRTNSYYVGANIPGKPRVLTVYLGGLGVYRERCSEIAANGYEGFTLTAPGTTRRRRPPGSEQRSIMPSEIIVEKNVKVAMRDGVELATDVYRPQGAGPLPAIVQRTPYDKEGAALRNYAFEVMRAVQAGYVCVVQDTRGRYLSDGEFDPFFDDGADGADTIEWVAAQPWCSGEVGMAGGSYFGATQWRAACEAPEALKAMVPFVTAADYHDGWTYQGGAFELGFNLHWTLGFLALGEVVRRLGAGQDATAELGAVVAAIDDNDALFERLPLTDMPVLSELAPYYRAGSTIPTTTNTGARSPRRSATTRSRCRP